MQFLFKMAILFYMYVLNYIEEPPPGPHRGLFLLSHTASGSQMIPDPFLAAFSSQLASALNLAMLQSPPKRKYILLLSWVLKTEGGPYARLGMHQISHWVGPNWAKPHFEIQRNGCIPTISKWGLVHFEPTPLGVWRTPYFSCTHPGHWVLGFAASGYFLLVETV